MKYGKHIGVYGVFVLDNKLLCIKKRKGIYQYRYDLPGGSQQKGEGFIETLKREILEETGYSVFSYRNSRAYDFFVSLNNFKECIHHLAIMYDIVLSREKIKEIPKLVLEGKNDSDGIEWVNFSQITCDNSSPLVLKVLAEYNKTESLLDTIRYEKWTINEEDSTLS